MADTNPDLPPAPELPPASVEEKPLETPAPHPDSKEARDDRKDAASKAYHADPPEELRAARKARSPQK